MAKERKPKEERFPVGRFFAWKTRDVSLGCQIIVLGYLSIYASTVLGMPVALVGGLMMASKVIDAFTDLFAGFIIDNTRTKLGRARPYELAILGGWLTTVLLFCCPPAWSMVAKSIWLFSMYALTCSIFQTLLYAGTQPYVVRAWRNRGEIIKMSSFGGIVTTLGSAVVSISFPRLMGTLATSAGGWRTLVIMFAVPLALIGMLRFFFVKEQFEPEGSRPDEKTSVKEIFQMLKKNPFTWDTGVMFGMHQMILGMGAATYYFTYVVGDIGKYGTLQAFTILMLILMFIFPTLMKKMSVASLVILGCAIGAAGYLLNFFAGANMLFLIIAFFMTGFSQLPVSYLQSPMLMEVSTYNEYIHLPRMDSSASAVMNFMGKCCNALGAGILGVLLQLSGFISTVEGAEAVTQPASAIFMIRCLYSLVPMLFMVLSILAARHFNKLSVMMPKIEKELRSRREEETTEEPAEA